MQLRSPRGYLTSGTTGLSVQMNSPPSSFRSAWLCWFHSQSDSLYLRQQESPASPDLVFAPYNLRSIKALSLSLAIPRKELLSASLCQVPSLLSDSLARITFTSEGLKEIIATDLGAGWGGRNVCTHEGNDYLLPFAEMDMKSTYHQAGQTVSLLSRSRLLLWKSTRQLVACTSQTWTRIHVIRRFVKIQILTQ